jgi:hypothetical protein
MCDLPEITVWGQTLRHIFRDDEKEMCLSIETHILSHEQLTTVIYGRKK